MGAALKSLIAFMQVVLTDVGTRCDTSTTRDGKTITRRYEHEGMSFLTISLPRFCSDFERSLDQGRVTHDLFTGFSWTGGLPRLLSGFLELVFDRSSGILLDVPSIAAIQGIRQITLLYQKIELPCTRERQVAALEKYVETEKDVTLYDSLLCSEPNRISDFERVARLLWDDFFTSVDFSIYANGVSPKHGPGATADKLRGNAKYNQFEWTHRLEWVLPRWQYLIPSESFLQRLDGVNVLDPEDERPVKVILVPKTLKTPRIIAVEPTCMQYMQQGVLATIMEEMSRHDNTRHFVCSKSQKPNQRLARKGSSFGTLATLDLSEASDRVSKRHVDLLISRFLTLQGVVDATRSSKAAVPGHGIIPLAKFASMGSALCFPFEALVFATVVFLGIEKESSIPLTKESVRSFFGKVRVYGDDIIVPVEFVKSVTAELEAFGFKINTKKSFWTGKFRESCGKEYYDGHDVSIARVRRTLPTDTRHADRLVSTIELRNRMFHLGYGNIVDYLDHLVTGLIPFPWIEWSKDTDGLVSSTSSLLGRHGHYLPSQEYRHDPKLQTPLVRGVVARSVSPKSILDDYGALMKWFLKQGDLPFVDRRHLLRAGRARSTRIKTRWATPY